MLQGLKESANILGYKDTRSVQRWCRNHHVGILKDNGSKRRYVIKAEFEAARLREAIRYMKEKYGVEEFPDAMKAHVRFYTEYLEATEKSNSRIQRNDYRPSGENEKKFLAILTNKSPEL